jgi:hypothetical protein
VVDVGRLSHQDFLRLIEYIEEKRVTVYEGIVCVYMGVMICKYLEGKQWIVDICVV